MIKFVRIEVFGYVNQGVEIDYENLGIEPPETTEEVRDKYLKVKEIESFGQSFKDKHKRIITMVDGWYETPLTIEEIKQRLSNHCTFTD